MDGAVSDIGGDEIARNPFDDDSEELIVELAFRKDVEAGGGNSLAGLADGFERTAEIEAAERHRRRRALFTKDGDLVADTRNG